MAAPQAAPARLPARRVACVLRGRTLAVGAAGPRDGALAPRTQGDRYAAGGRGCAQAAGDPAAALGRGLTGWVVAAIFLPFNAVQACRGGVVPAGGGVGPARGGPGVAA